MSIYRDRHDEVVVYIGNINRYATDKSTKELMTNNLKIGRNYKIDYEMEYNSKKDLIHYKLIGMDGYYPCESFISNLSEKYCLK